MKGDIIMAKNLESIITEKSVDFFNPDEFVHPGDGDVSQCYSAEKLGENWTSLQFSEAMSVLRKLLTKKHKKCQKCGAKNPKISKPTFGWFHMVNSLFLVTLFIFRN